MEGNCIIPKNQDLGMLILRLTLGVLFLAGGAMKFMGLEAFATKFNLPVYLMGIVAAIELLGGLALISGFMSRQAGVFLSIILLGAITIVYLPTANKIQILIHIALIGGLLNITFSGPGSIFALGCKKK